MIRKYINEISKIHQCNEWDQVEQTHVDTLVFVGNGPGNFEQSSNYTTKDALKKYLEYLDKQNILTLQALNNIGKE